MDLANDDESDVSEWGVSLIVMLGGFECFETSLGVTWSKATYMSNVKNPGCLGYIGDCTTQLCGYYDNPL